MEPVLSRRPVGDTKIPEPEKMNNLNVLLTSAIGWERFLFLKLAFYPSEFKFITGAVRGRGKTDNMH